MAGQTAYDAETLDRATEALLREHPDALVAALASNGLIVPVPKGVGLWGQRLIEGRAVIDNVVAADRTTVVRLWLAAQEERAVSAKVRMLGRPNTWMTLHFLNLMEIHGIVLAVIIPTDEDAEDGEALEEQAPAAPRFCTLTEDEGAKVLDCDPAFTQMFGYALEEMHGKSVLDQIHPDDQGRAVEGWLSMLATGRNQHTRLRRRIKDGGWMWVDTTLHNCLNEPGRNSVLVELIDISAEMQAQEALEEREELLRRLTDAMPVGLLQVDVERNVVYKNERLLEILQGAGPSPAPPDTDGVAGDTEAPVEESAISLGELLATLSEEAFAAFQEALDDVLGSGADRDVEVDFTPPQGSTRRAMMTLRALLRQSGEVNGAITCVLDVTDSARAREELEKRATFDELTGCHNRSSILAALERELERDGPGDTAVVYVDLDKFKPINDTLGHAAGDEVLIALAERLQLASRDSDLVGRLGGDEFIVVVHEVPAPRVAMVVAERICRSLASPFEVSGGSAELRASVGVACSAAEAVPAEELIRRADAAMYESKAEGRGQAVLAATVESPLG